MTVTVVAILETDFKPEKASAKIMNDRLRQAAQELEEVHLKALLEEGYQSDDSVVYLGYNFKYKIRFRIVNDVPIDVEYFVTQCCRRLSHIFQSANELRVSWDTTNPECTQS